MSTPQTNSFSRKAYKLSEAADLLGVSQVTVRRMIKRGLLKPCRALRHVLISAEELNRFLTNS